MRTALGINTAAAIPGWREDQLAIVFAGTIETSDHAGDLIRYLDQSQLNRGPSTGS